MNIKCVLTLHNWSEWRKCTSTGFSFLEGHREFEGYGRTCKNCLKDQFKPRGHSEYLDELLKELNS